VASKFTLILSENWTMTSGRDLPTLVRWAREAEDAGFDSVMISEHIVLGESAGANGRMANPREYALPGNQDPATPWPSSLVLLSAIAAVTERVRLVAGAIIAPLRHPLVSARELGTLDILSGGRLVLLPTVSWHEEEYAALDVPFHQRGKRLDEQLEVWRLAWGPQPMSFHGQHYAFDDVYLEPGAFTPHGPTLWLGGQAMTPKIIERIVKYGDGFNPLGVRTDDEMAALRSAMADAGRRFEDLELIGGTRATFRDGTSCADLAQAMDGIPAQQAQGYTTFCIKPSQFIDDPDGVADFCREVVKRGEAFA